MVETPGTNASGDGIPAASAVPSSTSKPLDASVPEAGRNGLAPGRSCVDLNLLEWHMSLHPVGANVATLYEAFAFGVTSNLLRLQLTHMESAQTVEAWREGRFPLRLLPTDEGEFTQPDRLRLFFEPCVPDDAGAIPNMSCVGLPKRAEYAAIDGTLVIGPPPVPPRIQMRYLLDAVLVPIRYERAAGTQRVEVDPNGPCFLLAYWPVGATH